MYSFVVCHTSCPFVNIIITFGPRSPPAFIVSKVYCECTWGMSHLVYYFYLLYGFNITCRAKLLFYTIHHTILYYTLLYHTILYYAILNHTIPKKWSDTEQGQNSPVSVLNYHCTVSLSVWACVFLITFSGSFWGRAHSAIGKIRRISPEWNHLRLVLLRVVSQ